MNEKEGNGLNFFFNFSVKLVIVKYHSATVFPLKIKCKTNSEKYMTLWEKQ